ncbi:uncharacterized protein LOC121048335 [Ixodes scapularis]|uniref:uncharacterized protein LOC121048335 n=1 Tax=Ixodes scapularis TaxID=6945 RepID=UPI001AD7BCF3|nr:uncharacterized protein LOC121048335 [Ixodes scapularis]
MDFERLINLLRLRRFLFDMCDPGFKDTQLKSNRWKLVGKEFGVSENLQGLNEARLAQQMTRPNDEFHHFGMMVAGRLRKMPRLQAVRAISVVQQRLLDYEGEHVVQQ